MKAGDTAVKQALELASGALCIAKKLGELSNKLIAEVERLSERESEAAQIIKGLLTKLEETETKAMLFELKPKAQRFLAGQKAARKKSIEKARTEFLIWEALVNEINGDTPERAVRKRIAASLNLTPQYVGRVLKRWKMEPKRR